MKHPKVLILIKRGHEYTNQLSNSTMKAGLLNSATFIKDMLINKLGIQANLEICIDANDIDRKIHKYKPTHCFLEAIWVTPDKITDLSRLHPKVSFVVRAHSKIPFLANEGVAIEWLRRYYEIAGNLSIAMNNKRTSDDLKGVWIGNDYLPNVYTLKNHKPVGALTRLLETLQDRFSCFNKKEINVGCFGAIRPLKNQLLQAVAAMEFANKHNIILKFHINGTRIEQKGETVIKNIRALFKDTEHILVEHSWLSHDDFLKLVKQMDIGLQLSFTESFNIVTADFVACRVPVIAGNDIEWMNRQAKCDPNSVNAIILKMEYALSHKRTTARLNLDSLVKYNNKAVHIWRQYFNSWKKSC